MGTAAASFIQDPEYQQAVTEIAKIAKRIKNWSSIWIFDTAEFAALVCLAFASGRRGRICRRLKWVLVVL
jgi:hypothetical protein